MHSIAKACAKGELTECGCDKSQSSLFSPIHRRSMLRKYPIDSKPSTSISFFSSTPSSPTHDGFEWGGCSDDLKFGRNVSTSFIDRQEPFISRRRIVRMVNLHNNEAGRQVRFNVFSLGKEKTLNICWFFVFRLLNEVFD